jgi:hypothetical protein
MFNCLTAHCSYNKLSVCDCIVLILTISIPTIFVGLHTEFVQLSIEVNVTGRGIWTSPDLELPSLWTDRFRKECAAIGTAQRFVLAFLLRTVVFRYAVQVCL